MSYETGMLVWGSAKSVGNIWVVTDGVSKTVSLLFDGKNKRYCTDYKLTKHDTIKASSFLYELSSHEKHVHIGYNGPLPEWANDFVKLRPSAIPAHRNPMLASSKLPPGVVQRVQQALGVNLTDGPERVIVRRDEEKCPIGGTHKFTPYTGIGYEPSYEFCVHCDKKQNFSR